MSTPNFNTINLNKFEMPLMIVETDWMDDFDFEIVLNDCEEIIENFNENLKYHKLEILSGHYTGLQVDVMEDDKSGCDLHKNGKYAIDNDDANYFYGKCRSRVFREADAEKRKIRKWLEKLPDICGYFRGLVEVGRFSNGEAVYEFC